MIHLDRDAELAPSLEREAARRDWAAAFDALSASLGHPTTKAAHDVSDETRDEHGRWVAAGSPQEPWTEAMQLAHASQDGFSEQYEQLFGAHRDDPRFKAMEAFIERWGASGDVRPLQREFAAGTTEGAAALRETLRGAWTDETQYRGIGTPDAWSDLARTYAPGATVDMDKLTSFTADWEEAQALAEEYGGGERQVVFTVEGRQQALNISGLTEDSTSEQESVGGGRYEVVASARNPDYDGVLDVRLRQVAPLVPTPRVTSGKAAHDVSDELRDDHGRWTAGGTSDQDVGQASLRYFQDHMQESVARQLGSAAQPPVEYEATSLIHPNLSVEEAVRDGVVADIVARAGIDEASARSFVNTWYASSAGSYSHSIALQQAVALKFGLPDAAATAGRLVDKWYDLEAPIRDAARADLKEEVAALAGDAARFVDAAYASTQEALAAHGVSELLVYRGLKWDDPEAVPAAMASASGEAEVASEPATSWTLSAPLAGAFAGASDEDSVGRVLEARVPAARVLSLPFTGVGALREMEVVVVGGPMRVRFSEPYWQDEDMLAAKGATPPARKAAHDVSDELRDERGRWTDGRGSVEGEGAKFPGILRPLFDEARKYATPGEFEHAFVIDIKHGAYFHWTNDPDFKVDPARGPRDMSSIGGDSTEPGALMVTSDPQAWMTYGPHEEGRPYLARLDLGNVPADGYRQVSRGFGNEFYLDPEAASRVRVAAVMPRERGLAWAARFQWALEAAVGGPEDLARIWRIAHGGTKAGPVDEARDERGRWTSGGDPHQEFLDAQAARGIRPLPMEPGLYYRLHPKDRTFGRADASTHIIGEPPSPSLAEFWLPKPGYSAFWNPHHLAQYLDEMGWEHGLAGSRVLAFRGTPIGEGADGEPRVMPEGDRPAETMSFKRFMDRLDITPNGYGLWDEHTWGDGPNGQQVDDGYRTMPQIGKEAKAAHDVSDEARDERGRWTDASLGGERVPTEGEDHGVPMVRAENFLQLERLMGHFGQRPEDLLPERYQPNAHDPARFGPTLRRGEVETHYVADAAGRPILQDVMALPEGHSVSSLVPRDTPDPLPEGKFRSGYGYLGGAPAVIAPGSERPLPYTFRMMSQEEWEGAARNGYIQSDARMNLGTAENGRPEGTVTSAHFTSSFYMAEGDNRLVRIRIEPGDDWRVDPVDQYIKTPDRIPFGRIDLVSPVLHAERQKYGLHITVGGKAAGLEVVARREGPVYLVKTAVEGTVRSYDPATGERGPEVALAEQSGWEPAEGIVHAKAGPPDEPRDERGRWSSGGDLGKAFWDGVVIGDKGFEPADARAVLAAFDAVRQARGGDLRGAVADLTTHPSGGVMTPQMVEEIVGRAQFMEGRFRPETASMLFGAQDLAAMQVMGAGHSAWDGSTSVVDTSVQQMHGGGEVLGQADWDGHLSYSRDAIQAPLEAYLADKALGREPSPDVLAAAEGALHVMLHENVHLLTGDRTRAADRPLYQQEGYRVLEEGSAEVASRAHLADFARAVGMGDVLASHYATHDTYVHESAAVMAFAERLGRPDAVDELGRRGIAEGVVWLDRQAGGAGSRAEALARFAPVAHELAGRPFQASDGSWQRAVTGGYEAGFNAARALRIAVGADPGPTWDEAVRQGLDSQA